VNLTTFREATPGGQPRQVTRAEYFRCPRCDEFGILGEVSISLLQEKVPEAARFMARAMRDPVDRPEAVVATLTGLPPDSTQRSLCATLGAELLTNNATTVTVYIWPNSAAITASMRAMSVRGTTSP
jgi:hypothetical protein